MRIEVTGKIGEIEQRFTYQMLECYDKKNNATAMARTTGYPASIVAQLIAQKVIRETGVIPLEKLGSNDTIFSKIITELEARQMKIAMANNEVC